MRHWVIADVHGCHAALQCLLALLPQEDRLVFCGDVINRGPAVAAAMETVWSLVERGRAIWLMGNHENALVKGLHRRDGSGRESLESCETFRQLGDSLCQHWKSRLAALPLAYWGDGWVATHAGFDPQTWQPDLTVRLPFWNAYDRRFGDVIVGHTPGPGIRRLGSIVLIDTAACHGGQLTAYCPETGKSLCVPGEPAASQNRSFSTAFSIPSGLKTATTGLAPR
jgi:serine/threonine protein phosphatase 1